ncbi:hypothetical protein COOONC_27908 [Cooperia oncophora]
MVPYSPSAVTYRCDERSWMGAWKTCCVLDTAVRRSPLDQGYLCDSCLPREAAHGDSAATAKTDASSTFAPPFAANPIYDVVSRTRIFEGLVRSSIGDQVVNILFGDQRLGTSDESYVHNLPPPSPSW